MNSSIIKQGNKLRKIASLKHLVYLTNNQISFLDSSFVIHKKPKDI